MIEVATQITTHTVAFVLGALSTLFSTLTHRAFKTWSIKKAVRLVLNDFATSWEAFLSNHPPNVERFSQRTVMPVLKKVANIREIIMDKPETLSNAHLREALEIADQINSDVIKPVGGKPTVSREDMDELAKRARECASKMGGKTK